MAAFISRHVKTKHTASILKKHEYRWKRPLQSTPLLPPYYGEAGMGRVGEGPEIVILNGHSVERDSIPAGKYNGVFT